MFKMLSLTLGFAMLAGAALGADTQYRLQVDGLTCPFCVATSERALKKIKGVKDATVNLDTGIINVCTDGSVNFTDDQLKAMFLKKGFTYRQMTKQLSCSKDDFTKPNESAAG